MPIIHEKLYQLMKQSILADFYRDFVDDESLTGFVSSFNDDFLCLSVISDSGTSNGISIVHISDITRIAWEGNERKSLKRLFASKQTVLDKLDIKHTLTIKDIAESVYKKFGHINLLTEGIRSGMAFIGEVIEIDESFIMFEGVGTFATLDTNKLLIRHSEITRIDAGGTYEQDIAWLSNSKSGGIPGT